MKMKRSQLKAYIRDRILKEERKQQALKILRESRVKRSGSVCIYRSKK